ncbi:glycine cleavage system H protein [Octopus bimaculoides]|uniref:Glycine cleavage system H protein n=1 Tax=Octopus bimaculoides TaxID=37653 RepID=A0A0L8HCL1_OCTBM|nr:glycine cleavage system H protein [Octopus bimaculoides]|eukprot:XP_014773497.1 PREDICTED: glycine cleavage system H protein-like [Octopus bimaculoides]
MALVALGRNACSCAARLMSRSSPVLTSLQKYRHFSLSSRSYSERFYNKSHEWISISNGVGTIGISDYAQDAIGEIVFVSLPDIGTELKIGQQCGEIESVKSVSELYSPMSGMVTETNSVVIDEPSQINASPFENGWLMKIEVSDKSESNELMSETAYQEFLTTFEH